MKTDVTLSNQAFRQLTKTKPVDDNREVIKDYLSAGGVGIELTEKQKELLERWEYADEKIRENMGKLSRAEIANLIVNKFKCSLCTAKSDMVNAEYVMSSSNPLSKPHRIQLRIEFLEKQSRLAAAANDYKAVGMIEKSIQKYIEDYPELTPVETPKTLIFNFDVEKLTDRLQKAEDAEDIIDEQLAKYRLLESMSEDITSDDDEGGDNE